ncbi:pre-mRNA-splicing factor CWC26 [Verticillium dahliae]|nr:pre-mRNA-splicing factor CWC26 [Verticillium dahliae]
MPSDLSSYLAKNYLVADPKPTKKRKRKQAAEGLIIADDDDASWAKPQASANDDVDGPATAEEREKERQAKIAPKGDVQAAAANARREALEEAKTMAFARGADDEDMNREMKGKERWNDPMAQFMQTDTATTTTGGKGKKGKNRPVYTGGAPPNRYGIRPGYRWDGVDRSNGFEGERFKAINRRERNKGLDYSWQMDE